MQDKYLILKIADIQEGLTPQELEQFRQLARKVEQNRQAQGRKARSYLVLNTDDLFARSAIEHYVTQIEDHPQFQDSADLRTIARIFRDTLTEARYRSQPQLPD